MVRNSQSDSVLRNAITVSVQISMKEVFRVIAAKREEQMLDVRGCNTVHELRFENGIGEFFLSYLAQPVCDEG